MSIPNNLFNEIYEMSVYELNNNFEYIGEGISRVVYGIGDSYVIKVSKNLDGNLQSKIENHIYHDTNSHLRRYLCPVLWYRKRMIVMPRAIPLSRTITKTTIFDILRIAPGDNTHRDLLSLCKTYNLLYEDILAPSSWGIINGHALLIDYGCPN